MVLKTITTVVANDKECTTTVFHLAGASSKVPLLVFIPGNPGFIDYYIRYLTAIHEHFQYYEILGISHAGFSSLSGPCNSVYSLQEQIDHKVAILKEYTGREVLIMGHSVGSYVLQRTVDALPSINWTFHALLMPTVVEIHKSSKGVRLHGITSNYVSFAHHMGYLGNITSYIPNKMLDAVLAKVLPGADPHAVRCTKMLITHPQFIRQALGMASEEMQVIQDLWRYQQHWFDKMPIWCVFTQGDHWIHDDTRDALVELLDGKRGADVMMTDEFTHSFCISKSDEFARVTIDKLQSLYQGD